jgi:hypothetical protein
MLLKGVFGGRDTLQSVIPAAGIHEAAEKGHALVPVVGADALHLIQEESLIELDNPYFQLLQDYIERLSPDLDVVLVQEMFSPVAIPVHGGNNMSDASKIGINYFLRIREDLDGYQ